MAVAAGLLLAAAFPKVGLAGAAWVAPGLMLVAAYGRTAGEAFRIGYVAGLAFRLASLYWLLLIPYRWHGIPLGPAAGWVALSMYLALYPAMWVWMVGLLDDWIDGKTQQPSNSFFHLSWLGHLLWPIAGAASWIALDMVVARLLGGFPWNFIGASQYRLVPLIQIASVTGVYGVSFLVVWSSLSLFMAVRMIVREPTTRFAWQREIILPMAALVATFVFGFSRLNRGTEPGQTLRVTFVQPSIPQTLIWDPKESTNRFRQLIELTAQALTNETDLLLWPESAVPNMIRYDEETLQAITGLARSNHVWMILGSDDMEPAPGARMPEDVVYYNASFLISPGGGLVDRYRKRNLVMFGEYVPFSRWLPFLKYVTPITGGFTPGSSAEPFKFELERQVPGEGASATIGERGGPLPGVPVKTAVLICFEDTFPGLARDSVEEGTDFLVNLTNDGWFDESAAPWQHAVNAVFRTVENGVPLLRCCNNGLTCWVDAQGEVQEIFHDKNDSVYGTGVMTAQIPLFALGVARSPTFYHQHGDWFGWSCLGLAVVMLGQRAITRRLK